MINREEIREWLENQFNVLEEQGDVSILTLMHVQPTGDSEVKSYTAKAGGDFWKKADRMADMFDQLAIQRARGTVGGGSQQFVLNLCRGEGIRPCAQLPFYRYAPPQLQGAAGSLASEPPTLQGQTQQGMRLLEIMAQGNFGRSKDLDEVSMNLIRELKGMVQYWATQYGEAVLALQAVVAEMTKRQHEHRMAELAAARSAEFQRQVMKLAPALINTIADKQIFPLEVADTNLLDAISEQVTEDEMKMLTAGLMGKPHGEKVAGLLMARFAEHKKRREAEVREDQRLMKETPGGRSFEEGEKDAMGQATRVLGGQTQAREKAEAMGVILPAVERKQLVAKVVEATQEVPTGVVTADPSSKDVGVDDGAAMLDELIDQFAGNLDMMMFALKDKNPSLADRILERAKKRGVT